ncbi:hypothetical protein KDM41_02915 [bacterium]|nr:hypothetical protein [bacterium]
MPTSSPAATDPRSDRERRLRSGANWFHWIAALSLLNSVIALFAGEWTFMFGLGITQVFDVFGRELAADGGRAFQVFALLLSAGACSTYFLLGWLAGRGKTAGFVVGMALYAADGLIFLLAGDWLGIAFHAFALYGMTTGFRALRGMRELAEGAVPATAVVAADIGPEDAADPDKACEVLASVADTSARESEPVA